VCSIAFSFLTCWFQELCSFIRSPFLVSVRFIHPQNPPVMGTVEEEKPPVANYVFAFILVGLAWGFTTPFIRRAARSHSPPAHPVLDTPAVKDSWIKSKLYGAFFSVIDLLRNPRYAVPLLLNLTGSVWFFLLIGQAGTLSR
jgi:hypothetical protein